MYRISITKAFTYYGRKLTVFIVSIIILSVLVFYISRLAPGDPLVSYYGDRVEKMSVEEKNDAREKLGLNAPLFTQYVRWAENALQGDFGISYKYKQDVLTVIGARIGNTLILGGLGFVITIIFSFLLGLLCAWNEEKLIDKLLCKVGTVTSCIPEFWLSLILIMIFAVMLKWLPSSGAYTAGNPSDITDRIKHLILPLIVVIVNHLWYYAYMIRNRLLEEFRKDYVVFQMSRGLSKGEIILKHCIKGVIPSCLSIIAVSVPHIMGGTYIIETVFSYPGVGTLSYESARYHDYNLLMVLCIASGIIVIICNMISQIINERIDPRIKVGEVVHEE